MAFLCPQKVEQTEPTLFFNISGYLTTFDSINGWLVTFWFFTQSDNISYHNRLQKVAVNYFCLNGDQVTLNINHLRI